MRLQRPEDLELHWAVERVTLGRHFLRDLEGLWAGVLKLAAEFVRGSEICQIVLEPQDLHDGQIRAHGDARPAGFE